MSLLPLLLFSPSKLAMKVRCRCWKSCHSVCGQASIPGQQTLQNSWVPFSSRYCHAVLEASSCKVFWFSSARAVSVLHQQDKLARKEGSNL